MLLVPTGNSPEPFRLLRSQKIPVVLLDRRVSVRQLDEVRCDSEAGAYALVRHLLGLGHRRIAVITGRRDISTSTDRVAGYERALAWADVPLDRDLIRYDSFSLAGGYRMIKDILAIEPRPTAVLATNNFIAFGALRALREASIDVPGDMSLVTFDDLPEEWHDDPFLTVLAQPAYELGRQAAELLFERLETGARGKRRVIVLPGAVIPRRSSGPPPVRRVRRAGRHQASAGLTGRPVRRPAGPSCRGRSGLVAGTPAAEIDRHGRGGRRESVGPSVRDHPPGS